MKEKEKKSYGKRKSITTRNIINIVNQTIYFAECSWAEFACEVDNKCILINKKCDGVDDCSDGADEVSCNIGRHVSSEIKSDINVVLCSCGQI